MTLVREFLAYLKKNKRLWLIPMGLVLLLIGLMIVLSESQAIAPILYASP